eukprot:EG_transcript_22304
MGNLAGFCSLDSGEDVWRAVWLSDGNEMATCSLSYLQLETLWRAYQAEGYITQAAVHCLAPDMLAGLRLAIAEQRAKGGPGAAQASESLRPEDWARLAAVRERYRKEGNVVTSVELPLLLVCQSLLDSHGSPAELAARMYEALDPQGLGRLNKLQFTSNFSRILEEHILSAPHTGSPIAARAVGA